MPFSAFGVQRLFDSAQRWSRVGPTVYLRTKNFADTAAIDALGLAFVPSVSGANVGVTDTPVDPPPTISQISMHSLAMAQAAGVQLRAGARKVIISNSWVVARQAALHYDTPQQVFADKSVVGLVVGNLLLEIVQYTSTDIFNGSVSWTLTCNASEISGA